jgi:diacylglycerol kinase (ATP)
MRVALIINPISGGRGRSTVEERRCLARAVFASRSIDASIEVTTHHGHAVELARRFVRAGMDRLIAWGGDGTANEVAGPLIGTDVVLGLVRGGSGDGLARGLGLPAESGAALAVALGDSVIRLDVGWLDDRHFLNVGSLGFDAAVATAFQDRSGRGLVNYVLAGFGCLWRYRNATFALDLEGAVSEEERFLVAFANGREYGNGFVVAASADPTDGLLDVVIVGRGSILRQVWRGRHFLLRQGALPAAVERRVRRTTVSGGVFHAHVDGEPFRTGPSVSVRVEAGALRLAAIPMRRAAG